MQTIRVGIVDDHALVRDGLRLILEREPDIDVVGDAADAAGAFALAATRKPHVMVVDLTLGESDGIALLRDLTSRRTSISRGLSRSDCRSQRSESTTTTDATMG